MATVEQAQEILRAFGLPSAQCNEMSGYVLLALCRLGPNDAWSDATRGPRRVTKEIMEFVKNEFGKDYAPNTRETFRRQVLHQLVQARIAEYNPFDPKLPTNSPRSHYAISDPALAAVHAFGTKRWTRAVRDLKGLVGTLVELYARDREQHMVTLKLPGDQPSIKLSPGKHNELQREIIEEFGPRFAPGAELLYVGDTAAKDLIRNDLAFHHLGIPLDDHGKFPDVILYDRTRDWLFLVEAVTSHGPMSPKRVVELAKLFEASKAGLIYVTAFLDFSEFRKHVDKVAWDTEIWIAEMPMHMIHYNGDRFIGPRR